MKWLGIFVDIEAGACLSTKDAKEIVVLDDTPPLQIIIGLSLSQHELVTISYDNRQVKEWWAEPGQRNPKRAALTCKG